MEGVVDHSLSLYNIYTFSPREEDAQRKSCYTHNWKRTHTHLLMRVCVREWGLSSLDFDIVDLFSTYSFDHWVFIVETIFFFLIKKKESWNHIDCALKKSNPKTNKADKICLCLVWYIFFVAAKSGYFGFFNLYLWYRAKPKSYN